MTRVQACINDDGIIGKMVRYNPNHIPQFIYDARWDSELVEHVVYLVATPKRDWAEVYSHLTDASQRYAEGSDLEQARAVALMRLGRAGEAINLLLVSEHTDPGRYATAANLGTAYELEGNLGKAKEWIAEGIARDPSSHEGTEWLHIEILKARMKLANDSDWLKSHSVTGLDSGADPAPEYPKQLDQERVTKALEYQLRERISFVPPPDAIVGDLLYDLAHLKSREALPIATQANLQLAKLYAPEMNRPLEARIRYFKAKRWARQTPDQTEIVTENLPIQYVEIPLLLEHLKRLVPEPRYTRVLRQRALEVTGSRDHLRQVKRLIEIIDTPAR